jgi:hypothetical protein
MFFSCILTTRHKEEEKTILFSYILFTIVFIFLFYVENAIDCTSFFDDPTDIEMWQVCFQLIIICVSS